MHGGCGLACVSLIFAFDFLVGGSVFPDGSEGSCPVLEHGLSTMFIVVTLFMFSVT